MNWIVLTSAPSWFYLGVLLGLVRECFQVSAACGLGNSSTKQTTITTEIANAFNTSNSWANSFTGGDSTLTLGGGSEGTSGLIGSLIPLVLAVFAGLAALYLLIRTK